MSFPTTEIRTLTFVLGFWVICMVLYALALAIATGVAFGYDYCLAEYTTLARPDASIELKPREYKEEVLSRRSSDSMTEGDEFKAAEAPGSQINFVAFLPSWLYKGTTKYIEYSEPTRTTQSSTSITRTRTVKVKKVIKVSKAPKTRVLSTTTKSKKVSKASKKVQPRTIQVTRTSIRASKTSQSASQKPSRTTKKVESSQFSNVVRDFWKSITESSTSVTRIPKAASKSLKPRPTKTISIKHQTSTLRPHVIRVFRPKSTLYKWRPTKPEKFFYKTSTANYRRRIMKEDLGNPEMEIWIPSYGRHKGLPMRHWHVSTKTVKEADTTYDENYYRTFLYF